MTIYPSTAKHRKPIWIVSWYTMGAQKRKQFKRNPDAERADDAGYRAAEKFSVAMTKKIFNEGPSLAGMDNTERIALLHLYATVKGSGLTISQAEAVIVASMISKPNVPLVPEVAEECVNSKRARLGVGISERYIKQLGHVLTHFAEAFKDVAIDRIRPSQIETWIQSGDYSAASRRSRLTDIRTMFSFAVKREYLEKSPCEKITPIVVQKKTPGILSPRQAAKLMRVAYNRDRTLCPWLALSLFCGIRPEELNKLTRADVLLEKKIVHISESVSKTGTARNVEIPENALEWLRLSGDLATVRPDSKKRVKLQGVVNLKERFDRVRRQAGLFRHWPHDAMRHSSVTYLYALTNDEGYVTKQHGHSIRVMLCHYNAAKLPSGEIVTKELAKEYFEIRPKPMLRVLEDVA